MTTYNTAGVCAKEIDFELKDGFITNVRFNGGCPGNLQAISVLVEGMPAEEVIKKLKGITCGQKTTSCTDQLVNAILEQMKKK
ncbi:TIGR03905 family TSCPD domain-containing protein [Pelosinus baikalensis]|uniref:ribonucleoside-diphosphate reductase n=1 Tax=Pelosinus baikalensis TaxID=2892015 RepID=A0ABS8HP87_9FIRM|nr:TIGR03905 family TSCPD domain-containing protein [Pelosinus baikalensis]MCC5464063.1 TIGR03905 family TSCPD domain-containing protein [Pelosinus baikalensis]